MNVDTILLDIDNTIKPYGSKIVDDNCYKWINEIKAENIDVILLSNNYDKNVKPFANSINTKYISFCLKPSPFAYFRAKRKYKIKFSKCIVIGDQIFTDIIAAKIMHIKSILVDPIDKQSEGTTVKIRRKLLKCFDNKIKKNKLK